MKNIGLVGVGAMGEPMGASLMRAGFSLRVCPHRSRERVEREGCRGGTRARLEDARVDHAPRVETPHHPERCPP